MEDISIYGVGIDSDLVNQDFDDIDLFGEIMNEDDQTDTGLLFE